jgi:hypothetical protein
LDCGRKKSVMASRPALPERAGAIKAAVVQVLGRAEAPLRLNEIHSRCEATMNCVVSYATVKDCVHKHAHV